MKKNILDILLYRFYYSLLLLLLFNIQKQLFETKMLIAKFQ